MKSKLPIRYPELNTFVITNHEKIKSNYLKFARYLNQADVFVGLSPSEHDVFLYYLPTLIMDTDEDFFDKLEEMIQTLESYDDYVHGRNNFRQIVECIKDIRKSYLENEAVEYVIDGLDFRKIPVNDNKV